MENRQCQNANSHLLLAWLITLQGAGASGNVGEGMTMAYPCRRVSASVRMKAAHQVTLSSMHSRHLRTGTLSKGMDLWQKDWCSDWGGGLDHGQCWSRLH